MKIDQFILDVEGVSTQVKNDISQKELANLVLVFGSRELFSNGNWFDKMNEQYPNAEILSCSAEEQILGQEIQYNSISATAIQFEKTKVQFSTANIAEHKSSYETGKELVNKLDVENLNNILVISDGQKVNGSELVKGINDNIDKGVIITGGLASDGDRFEKTLVGINQTPQVGNVVLIGFYGDHLSIGYGSKGGWDAFGPKRKVTKSIGNILQELDEQNALDLYKTYLGDQASGLPGTALLFPLALHIEGVDKPLVRTVLNVNEDNNTMIFAGDVPEGSYVQLMKANFDRVIDGSYNAAINALTAIDNDSVDFALLISCIGRKLVLGPRVDEEVEGVKDVFGDNVAMAGFYSYGEISPLDGLKDCQLHNQTMTITTFTEKI